MLFIGPIGLPGKDGECTTGYWTLLCDCWCIVFCQGGEIHMAEVLQLQLSVQVYNYLREGKGAVIMRHTLGCLFLRVQQPLSPLQRFLSGCLCVVNHRLSGHCVIDYVFVSFFPCFLPSFLLGCNTQADLERPSSWILHQRFLHSLYG